MAIPVLHKIHLVVDHTVAVNHDIYKHPLGQPPKYHVICSCQWEGWAHDERTAKYFVSSHEHAQNMRGNPVEIISALSSAEASAPALDQKPTLADAEAASVDPEASAPVGLES
jgi:hypothetical protein